MSLDLYAATTNGWRRFRDGLVIGGPPEGRAPFWGAAHGGNTTPTTLENATGRSLGVRRTYFDGSTSGINSAVNMGTADTAAGRVPWLSLKFPTSWGNVAAGNADTFIDQLWDGLATIPGPVMFTWHHEPEGDETPFSNWVPAMDRAHARLLAKGYTNIRNGPILTGWDWIIGTNTTYRLDTVWPGAFNSGHFLAFDCYNYYDAYTSQGTFNAQTGIWSPPANPAKITNYVPQSTYTTPLAAFAQAKGIKWAIGEYGLTAGAAVKDINDHGEVRFYRNAWNDALRLGGCLALAYFNSAYHSRADWRIEVDSNRLNAWAEIAAEAPPWRAAW